MKKRKSGEDNSPLFSFPKPRLLFLGRLCDVCVTFRAMELRKVATNQDRRRFRSNSAAPACLPRPVVMGCRITPCAESSKKVT
jgi:hypothetical protein